MSWDVVREYGQREVSIPFEGSVRVDLPKELLDSHTGLSAALAEVDAGLARFAQRLAAELSRARDSLSRHSDPLDEKQQVLPWITAGLGREEPVVVSHNASLVAALVGRQALTVGGAHKLTVSFASISVTANRHYVLNPIRIELDSIELLEGSLWARFKGAIKTPAAVATFVLAALGATGTPLAVDKYQDWKYEERIESIVEGQQCGTKVEWKVRVDGLHRNVVESLNYAAPGLSSEEATLRKCNVQLALALGQGSPLKIDGVIGHNSRQALKVYAATHGVEPDIGSEVLRGFLARELTRPSQR